MRIPYLPLLKMSSTIRSSTTTASSSSLEPSSPLPLQHVDTYVIGLNAALQKRFVIDSIQDDDDNDIIPGNVYRASSISYGVGGKGQDVAYTLNCLQYGNGGNDQDGIVVEDVVDEEEVDEETLAEAERITEGVGILKPPFHLVQFIGTGYEGDTVFTKMSNDFTTHQPSTGSMKSALSSCTVRTVSTLRTCTSIVTKKSTTELIDPSGIITPLEITELLHKVQQTASSSSSSNTGICQSMCFMGSMPPGCPSDLYAKIYHTILTAPTAATSTATTTTTDTNPPSTTTPTVESHRHVLCFIDSVVGLKELLQQISTTGNDISSSSSSSTATPTTTTTIRTILKINVAELCRYVSVPIQKEAEGVPRELVVDAITKFWQQQQQQQSVSSSSSTSSHVIQPNVIALTNGAHPAYLAILKSSQSSSLLLSFDLYQLPIASPFRVVMENDTVTTTTPLPMNQSTLYPIGAGDAVAAGTFAAWNYHVATTTMMTKTGNDNDPTNDSIRLLPASIRQVFDEERRTMWKDCSIDSDELYLSCFRFGLACGSASCIQEENSIVSIPHVLQLFQDISDDNDTNDRVYPKSTHSIPIMTAVV